MILADSSVWIDFWRQGDPAFQVSLLNNQILLHPFVFGELFLGQVKDRERVFREMAHLPGAPLADESEVLELVERFSLVGSGIGWVDAHLLASALLAKGDLMTKDLALKRAWLKVRHRR